MTALDIFAYTVVITVGWLASLYLAYLIGKKS